MMLPMRAPQKPSGSSGNTIVLQTVQTAKPAKQSRSDGMLARQNLLACALKLFAEKGFAKTSTREIAQAAGANIAAISYYFGDKAGLYRATFVEPMGNPKDDIALYDQPHFTLRQSLEGFYASFLEPIKDSGLVQQCVKLHFREMLEPTGMWEAEVERGIKPAHLAMVAILRRHLKLTRADDEVYRLALAISALALQMYVGRDVIDVICPQLVSSSAAIDRTCARLADFAEAMVEGERLRRARLATLKPAAKTPK
jgi:TetR/AcrR family transcriptional regulator, regulator of cefoperazone and chloramphenicol sensitivity